MKKSGLMRYNLDKVYFLSEYNKTVAYGKQNISIGGVKEKLQELERERQIYAVKVANIVTPEKATEQFKYQQYQKWESIKKKSKWAEICLILLFIVRLNIFKYLPIGLRTSLLYTLFDILFAFSVVLFVPLVLVISKVVAHGYALRYKKYIEPITATVNNLGTSFQRLSIDYYDAIDTLYLLSLDPVHREMILLRRQQEEHNRRMVSLEKERKKTEEAYLKEQQRARRATEELLAIEKEREKRYNRW